MSRPRKTFNEKDIQQMESLARCHCTDEEIAAFLNVSESTIKRRFGPVLTNARSQGKANLRAKQFKLAMDGNPTLLIWLGKQLLGQQDRLSQEVIEKLTPESSKLVQELWTQIELLFKERDECLNNSGNSSSPPSQPSSPLALPGGLLEKSPKQ